MRNFKQGKMLDTVKNISRSILRERQADGVLGLTRQKSTTLEEGMDIIQPHVFADPGELDDLVIEPKWLFAKLAMTILRSSPESYRLAVICRGCDERAVIELIKRNQIEKDRIATVGIACSQEQASVCLCQRPYPEKLDAGVAAEGVDPFQDGQIRELLMGDDGTRMEKWAKLLKRCIKCYGCRNSCPICVCIPCKLEDEVWVDTGSIPAGMIPYHLIRAFHLSDTCVACGACQEACPVHIPLLALQLSMREILRKNFGYEAGIDPERKSPVLFDFSQEPSPERELPAWIDSLKAKI